MAKKPKLMPTLTAKGWISSTPDKLDHALAHFYESEETQTYLFPGQVADVHSIIARNTDDMDRTANELAQILENYLKTLFQDAQVKALNVNRETGDPSSTVTITMEVGIKDHEKLYDANRIAYFQYKKFNKIMALNNEGIYI